jgi:hypothetical protein
MATKSNEQKLKERRIRANKILKKLGLHSKTDLTVILTPRIKYGVSHTTIKVNPYLSDKEFDMTMLHEILHFLGLPHNESTRKIHYSSADLKKDALPLALLQLLEKA